MRAGNTELALSKVTASPVGNATEVATAVSRSYTGQRWDITKDLLAGKMRPYPRAHRIQMVDAVAVLLGRIRSGASEVIEEEGGFLTMGNASGGFVFRERDCFVRDISRMGTSQLKDMGLLSVSHVSETSSFSVSCGRGTKDRISSSRVAARRAAAADSRSDFTSHDNATAFLKRVCHGSRRPLELDALRSQVLSTERLLQVAKSLNPDFVCEVCRIIDASREPGRLSAEITVKVASNQALRAAVLQAWAALRLSDFDSDPPHFAYIYAVLLTLTAKQWRDECHRVLVVGERVSLVFGDDLPLGYRVMLARMFPLATAAADAELLTAIYFGQEHRGAKSKGKCGRWLQHTTKHGSLNICQAKYVTNRRSGFVYKPLGDIIVEVRFVAMLPGGDNYITRINGAEALVFAACCCVPGFVSVNDSPPGEDTRLLVPTWAGPPRIFQLCAALVDVLGGEERSAKIKLCDSAVSASAGPFLRGVLETMHLLMENGLYAEKDGTAIKVDFAAGTRTPFAKYSVLKLVSAVYASIDVDGSTSPPRQVYTLALWCDSCSCPYVGPLCKHLIAARILQLVQGVAPSWHGSAEELYWGAGPMPSYAVRCWTAPPVAAGVLSDDADAEEQAAEDLAALYATVGHHLALIAGRAAAGDSDSVRLSDVARALRGFAGRTEAWSGARIVEPGAAVRRGGILGRFQPRSGSVKDVEADRAAGPQLRKPLDAEARLKLLAYEHPLPQSDMATAEHPICRASEGSAEVADSHDAAFRAWAAAAALIDAAPRVSAIVKARALSCSASDPVAAAANAVRVLDGESDTAEVGGVSAQPTVAQCGGNRDTDSEPDGNAATDPGDAELASMRKRKRLPEGPRD
jgi:hypothetical protein